GIHTLEVGLDSVVGETRAQVRALHAIRARTTALRDMSRIVEVLIPDRECRAERATRVASRRLYPHPIERSLAEYPAVAHAIEGDAAGEAQVALTRLPMNVTSHVQHG